MREQLMKKLNITANRLESEGTDSGATSSKLRYKYISKNTMAFTLLLLAFIQNVSANQLHLFSDTSGAVVGTITAESSNPVLIEGFIENNILEAIEIISTDSDGLSLVISTGSGNSSQTDANSDGTGSSTDANSDGTGSSTDANSDGTGSSTDANSDGTGRKLFSVLLSCDINSVSTAIIESTEGTETMLIESVYLNKQIYTCN